MWKPYTENLAGTELDVAQIWSPVFEVLNVKEQGVSPACGVGWKLTGV
jgi:hypothetical protein